MDNNLNLGQSVQIRVGTIEDKDKPLFPEFLNVTEGKLVAVGILEGGMISGKASVGLFIEVNGSRIVAQISNEMLQNIAGAGRGAQDRFSSK